MVPPKMIRTVRRRVLIALHLSHAPGQRKLSGIFSHVGSRANWDIRILRTQQEVESPEFDNLLRTGIDGIIYSAAYSPKVFARLAKADCPLVCMEHAAALLAPRRRLLVTIRNDSRAIARTAVGVFAHNGKYESFAYVHDLFKSNWSRKRAAAFRHELKGKVPPRIHAPTLPSATEDAPALVRFLKKLPKPAAVLAAHDSRATDVIQAAITAGIAVPDDIAVLGIDNDQYVCDTTIVPISSIEPDHFAEGKAAAEELDAMMNGTSRKSVRQLVFGVRHVIARGSTRNMPPAQSVVSRAKDYIRDHALEGIAPPDVAAALGISRQLLYLRFRQSESTTAEQLIRQRKLDEACRLLRETKVPINAIPQACGFKNGNSLKNIFRKAFGMSMRDFRNKAIIRAGGGSRKA